VRADAAESATTYSNPRISALLSAGAHTVASRGDRRDDVRVRAAAAQVAAHRLADLGIAAGPALRDDRDGRQNLSRRAEAALERVVLHERGLHRVQLSAVREALDRHHVVARVRQREREARERPATVHEHRARAALAAVAPFLRTFESGAVAQQVEQRNLRFDHERGLATVQPERERDGGTRGSERRVGSRHGKPSGGGVSL
jgi:hypothetical protein